MIKSSLLKLSYLLSGIRSIGGCNIGDIVIKDGVRYTLMNGPGGIWWSVKEDGCDYDGLNKIHKNDFIKKHSLMGAISNIRGSYGFLMGYWHDIHMRNFSYRDIYNLFFPPATTMENVSYTLNKITDAKTK